MNHDRRRPTLDEAFAGLLQAELGEFRSDLRVVTATVQSQGTKLGALEQEVGSLKAASQERHRRCSEQFHRLGGQLEQTDRFVIGTQAEERALRKWLKRAGAIVAIVVGLGGLASSIYQCSKHTHASAGPRVVDLRR